MISASTSFKNAADDPQRLTQKKFVFNGTDYSEKIDDLGEISIRQYEGDGINAQSLSITMINDDKTFNILMSNMPGNFGKAGTVSLGFDGEYIDIFKGYLDRPEFSITDRHRANLFFTAKLKACIERTLGSGAFPLNYYSSAWNPADLVWDLLTTRGELDATTSTANPDIDYAVWLEYKTLCADLFFSLKANFTGTSIAEALRLIGYLTDAVIYPDPTGKVICRKFMPRETSSPYLFTDANGKIQSCRYYANRSRVINKMKAWYGYNPSSQTWAGSVTYQNTTSQTNYGLLGREADSATVWHADQTSAGVWAEHMINRYTDPSATIEIETYRGTQALLHQVGDICQITVGAHDLSAKNMQIYGIDHKPSIGDVGILAEDMGILNQSFFILDSATNGILDQNILY